MILFSLFQKFKQKTYSLISITVFEARMLMTDMTDCTKYNIKKFAL